MRCFAQASVGKAGYRFSKKSKFRVNDLRCRRLPEPLAAWLAICAGNHGEGETPFSHSRIIGTSTQGVGTASLCGNVAKGFDRRHPPLKNSMSVSKSPHRLVALEDNPGDTHLLRMALDEQHEP